MLGQRLRRCPNIKTAWIERVVFELHLVMLPPTGALSYGIRAVDKDNADKR